MTRDRDPELADAPSGLLMLGFKQIECEAHSKTPIHMSAAEIESFGYVVAELEHRGILTRH
jgi:hypothetical protein